MKTKKKKKERKKEKELEYFDYLLKVGNGKVAIGVVNDCRSPRCSRIAAKWDGPEMAKCPNIKKKMPECTMRCECDL